jgi:tetratricopeptide (TPR) repeat protein
MRRTAIISFILTAALLAAYAAWPVSLAAEPISASDVAAPAGTSAAPSTPQELKDALAMFNRRDYEGALKLLKEAVKKNPDLGSAYLNLADWFLKTNNASGLRGALERAVAEAPSEPEAYVVMGDIAVGERRFTEARMLYDRAEGLMPKWNVGEKRKTPLQSRIFNGLAATDEARADWAAAQKQLDAWLKVEPDPKNTTLALQRLARCLFQQKDVQGAYEKLKAAKKLNDEILTPEAQIARFYAQTGDQKNATKWMTDALSVAPKDLNTRLNAAQLAFETGDLDNAKKQAATALQLNANSFPAKMLCGLVALFQKDYSAAELYFDSAARQQPKEFGASNNLALALIEQKDPEKRDRALQYAEANVRQYPKAAEVYSTYGWILYKLNRLNDAETALRNAISGGTFTPETAYYMGRVVADSGGRDAEAVQWLEGAVKANMPFRQRDDATELLEKLKRAEKLKKP